MAAPAAASPCAQCGGAGALRCAGCRGVHYCSRGCQKAAWPAHKRLCKHTLSNVFKGQQLTSERGFVREYWAHLLPAGRDMESLLGPPGEPLDAAAAFERCQAAAMDLVIPGWSRMSEGARGAMHVASELAEFAAARARGEAVFSGADLAARCIDRLCAAELERLLIAGVRPGNVALVCGGRGSLLQVALRALVAPYPQSPAALPHALAMLRVLLARAQPGDWLVGSQCSLPLYHAAFISDPAVSQAVLDAIVASPGGFPAHAVAASPGVLQVALQRATPAFVRALLAAGAEPNTPSPVLNTADCADTMLPLHALAFDGDPRDVGAKLRLLLDAGAQLEATGDSGRTALVQATMNMRPAAFDALLAAGAQASALGVNLGAGATRFTVLHHLAASNDASLIPRVLATRALDVDMRAGPATHFTPLHMAAARDAPRAVSALLAGGASLAATAVNGMTALQLAIGKSSAQAARPLVEATPRAVRARLTRDSARAVAARARDAAAAGPADMAAAAAKLAAARAISALLAA
jgi:ankyrin repeat protein